MATDEEKSEVLFENAYLMTRERYLELCAHPKAKNAVKRLRKWRIILALSLLLSLILAVSGILQREFYLALIGITFALVFLYRGLFQPNIQNKKIYSVIRKSQASEEWNRTIRFYESGIDCEDVNVITHTDYHQISHFTDDGEMCFLWVGDDTVIRLMHSEFTIGSYEDFAAFINRKLAEGRENNT